MAGKVSKASVNYRVASLLDFARRCRTCAMYRAGACTLVAGPISPVAVCDRWTAK